MLGRLSDRGTFDRDPVSNLVNATSEFPFTYQRGLLRGLIDEDLVPGSVEITLNYPSVWDTEKGDGLALNLPLHCSRLGSGTYSYCTAVRLSSTPLAPTEIAVGLRCIRKISLSAQP